MEKIIEGFFNGERMVGDNDYSYPVKPNYASKSRLVEGDRLKLTISNEGNFIFKQIGQVARVSVIGILQKNHFDKYSVKYKDKTFKVLDASVHYYNGQVGDKIAILIPNSKNPTWAAIDNLIKEDDDNELEI